VTLSTERLREVLEKLGCYRDNSMPIWNWPRQEWCSVESEGDFNPCLKEEIRLALREEGWERYICREHPASNCCDIAIDCKADRYASVSAASELEALIEVYMKVKE